MLVMEQASSAESLVGERVAKPDFEVGTSMRRFQDQGLIRVGVVCDAPGFSARNPDTRRFQGLDITIARRLAQSIFGGTLCTANRNIEFVELKLGERTTSLAEHRVDIVASVFIPTEERRAFADFTDAYYGSPMGLIGRYSAPVTSIEDLARVSIALTPGTVDESVIKAMGFADRIVECSDNDDTINTVLAGGADVGVMSSVIMDAYLRRNLDLVRMPFALDTFPYAVGVQKGDEALRTYLNLQIGDMLRQGFVSLAEMVRRRGN